MMTSGEVELRQTTCTRADSDLYKCFNEDMLLWLHVCILYHQRPLEQAEGQ